MPTDVILPRVDMDMTTGRISHWFAKAGERVEKGAVLFEIETDKAAMEIDAPVSGRIQILVNVGAEVPVGATVGWILADGESDVVAGAAVSETVEPAVVADVVVAADTPLVELPPRSAAITDIRATPLSRRLAAERGIALAEIVGSGPKGRIQARDIPEIAPQSPVRSQSSDGLLNGTWLRQGAGEPIVLIHGFGADLGSWRPFVGTLPATLPIYALDLPGHGASALNTVGGLDDIVSLVIATLAEAGIGGGHLVGHSLGGAVATLVAASERFAAKSLFLLAPGGLGPEINSRFIHGFAGATSEAAIGAWMRELVEDAAVITPASIRQTASARTGSSLVQSQTRLADLLFPEDTQGFSILAALGALTAPVRVIFGRADRIIPASHAQRLPGHVALHLFPAVGHMPQTEASATVGRLLLQHIRSAG